MTQTDTRTGSFRVLAGEDLTDKEGYLVVLTHDGGVPEVKLPADNGAYALYALINGGEDAGNVDVMPLESGANARLALKGTCSPGDVLVLADTAVAADKGKVRVLPAAAGTYRGLAVAEETGVDGQFVLCRPALIGPVTVAG